MAVLHLFNPENDLALAAGIATYTPPPAAVELRRRGALLPMWFASAGDYVLAPRSLAAEAERFRRKYGLQGDIFTPGHADAVVSCAPWGWSAAARRLFVKAGVADAALPSDDTIARMRALSHRRTSVAILQAVGWPQLPVEAATVEAAFDAVGRFGGRAFLKFPWSSSGRGVFDTSTLSADKIHSVAAGCIRRQGSVMVEPAYNKVSDFAMLYCCSGGRAEFHGLSCFATHAGGAYAGNVIAPQSHLAKLIGIPTEDVAEAVCAAITAVVAPHYSGPLGVDMMVAESDGGSRFIMPCIELNLRYTMGFVALEVMRRAPQLCPALTTDDFLYII